MENVRKEVIYMSRREARWDNKGKRQQRNWKGNALKGPNGFGNLITRILHGRLHVLCSFG
jgi:hypothetical protein